MLKKLNVLVVAAVASAVLILVPASEAAFSPYTTTDKKFNCKIIYAGEDVNTLYYANWSDPITAQFTSRSGGTTTSNAMHDRLESRSNYDWRGGYIGLSHGQYNAWTEESGTRRCGEMQEGNATGGPLSSRYHVRWNNGGRVPYAQTTVIATPHHDHFCLSKRSHEVDDWVGARTKLVNYFRGNPYERRRFYKGNYLKREFYYCINKTTGSDGYVVRVSGP